MERATKCLATALSSLAASSNHCLADLALVMVSRVVKVCNNMQQVHHTFHTHTRVHTAGVPWRQQWTVWSQGWDYWLSWPNECRQCWKQSEHWVHPCCMVLELQSPCKVPGCASVGMHFSRNNDLIAYQVGATNPNVHNISNCFSTKSCSYVWTVQV